MFSFMKIWLFTSLIISKRLDLFSQSQFVHLFKWTMCFKWVSCEQQITNGHHIHSGIPLSVQNLAASLYGPVIFNLYSFVFIHLQGSIWSTSPPRIYVDHFTSKGLHGPLHLQGSIWTTSPPRVYMDCFEKLWCRMLSGLSNQIWHCHLIIILNNIL